AMTKFQGTRGCPVQLDFSANEGALSTELEQPRLTAMPGALELDGLDSMAIVEAGGDQEKCVEICAVLEGMMCDEVFQILVLLGLEMLCQGAQVAFDTDFITCRQWMPHCVGEVDQPVEHVVPSRVV